MSVATTVSGRRFCPACASWSDAFRPDRNAHPDRACPRCQSLERHRFLALLLPALVARRAAGIALDVAPTRALSLLLDRLVDHRIGVDYDPAADGRIVHCQTSLTHLPLPDASVDLVLCSHVLEHVPDDLAAMREIARVLAPTGIGVVAVPRRRGRPTDEDPAADTQDRVARFGQADHVRYYGDDFVDRLTASGLGYDEVTSQGLLPAAVVGTCGFMPSETFWLVRPSSAAAGQTADLAGEMVGELMRLLAAADAHATADATGTGTGTATEQRTLAEQQRLRLVGAARRTRAHYRRRTGRAPVRLALTGWAALKRALAVRS